MYLGKRTNYGLYPATIQRRNTSGRVRAVRSCRLRRSWRGSLCHAGRLHAGEVSRPGSMSQGVCGAGGGGDFAVTEPGWAPPDPRAAEEESYRIVRSRIDLSRLPRFSRDVTERVIQASADFDYFTDLVCDEDSLAAGVAALAAGAPVIADCAMVAAGITDYPVISKIGEPLTARLARTAAISPAAAAVRLAFGEAGPGAVWVVGGTAEALPGDTRPARGGRVRGRAARPASSARPRPRTPCGPAACGRSATCRRRAARRWRSRRSARCWPPPAADRSPAGRRTCRRAWLRATGRPAADEPGSGR